MGTKTSKADKLPLIDEGAMKTLLSSNLRAKHMRKIHRLFKEIDVDCLNGWTASELFRAIQDNRLSVRAPIIDALFFMGDTRGEGTLNWEDFMVTFISFCALSRAEVMQLLFIIVDRDRKGRITKQELLEFFSYVPVGAGEKKPVFPINNKNCLDKFRGGKWTSLTFDGLAGLCESFPYISYPAYHAQDMYRRVMLGYSFWERLDKERVSSERFEKTATVLIPGSQGDTVTVKLPPFCTMPEILEYSRRKTEEQQGRRVHSQRSGRPSRLTAERDEQISRCPIMTLIRNPRCMYYVPREVVANEHAMRASQKSLRARPELELQDLVVREKKSTASGRSGIRTSGVMKMASTGGVLTSAARGHELAQIREPADEEEDDDDDASDSEYDSDEDDDSEDDEEGEDD